jgi:membrane protein DedA with SNARE-associated domain
MPADRAEQTGPAEDATQSPLKRYGLWLALAFTVLFVVLPRLSPFGGINDGINDINVFRRFSAWLIGKTETLFVDHGYWVVFLGVLLENSAFLGLLVPGAVILILGGLAAENGAINLWWVLVLGIIATIIGDTLSYAIGRVGWARGLQHGNVGAMMERVRTQVDANSTWIILAYHFTGYSRVVGPLAAGAFRIPYRRWAPVDYAGGALWVVAFTSLGLVLGLFGVEFGDTKRMVQLLEWALLAMLVIAVALTFRRVRQATEAAEEVALHALPGRHAHDAVAHEVVEVDDKAAS